MQPNNNTEMRYQKDDLFYVIDDECTGVYIMLLKFMGGVPYILVQECNPEYVKSWKLPGGKIEDGEAIETTIVRELKEETGIYIYNYKFQAIQRYRIECKSGKCKYIFVVNVFDDFPIEWKNKGSTLDELGDFDEKDVEKYDLIPACKGHAWLNVDFYSNDVDKKWISIQFARIRKIRFIRQLMRKFEYKEDG